MATELTLSIPGFQIACKAWGNQDNPILIALHGWLDNATSFEPLAQFLLDKYYVVAIDLPGHGLSSHLPDGCHYHFIDGIFHVFSAIDELGYDKINLLGHSMGACLSSLMAGVMPDRIKKMFLIEGLGPFSAPDSECRKQLHQYMNRPLGILNQPSRPYDSMDKAAEARAKRGHVSFDIAKTLCQRGVCLKDGKYYWRHDRRLITPTPLYLTEEQILDCLSYIKAPTQLILADQGFGYPEDLMKQRIKMVKTINTHVLPGGHHIHMESPRAIATVIMQY